MWYGNVLSIAMLRAHLVRTEILLDISNSVGFAERIYFSTGASLTLVHLIDFADSQISHIQKSSGELITCGLMERDLYGKS